MCGITGFSIKEEINNKKSFLKLMNDKLSHRGPDGEGFYNDELVSLAHKRLAIIDLNPRSNQPLHDHTKNYVITFNGEIYNYIELKKILVEKGYIFSTTSDTEVLLNSYICWGTESLKKIKGMFSFAIYDKRKNIIFCARDHFGQKPFFYYYKNGNFIFSSELTSLITNPLIEKKICTESIAQYFHYDSFIDNTTPILNCYKLLPSEYLIFDISNKNLKKDKYWNLNIKQEKEYSNNHYNDFIQKITRSTELHLRSDVPIALYLSGGIDSTVLAYISKNELKNNNIKAFNLKFKNESFNENLLATDTSKKLDLDLTTFNLEDTNFISVLENNINKIDEPLADLGLIAIGFMANFISMENYKVVISGDGGDELLMGCEPFQKYWLFKIINNIALLSKFTKYIASLMPDSYEYMGISHKMKIFSKALGFDNNYSNTRWICSFLPEEIERLTNKKSNLNEKQIYNYILRIISSIDSNDDYDQLNIQYQKHFLTNLICSHTDKANMHYSIEARSPFLDHELFEFTNKLPKNYKLNKGLSKIILRNFLKKNLNNSTYKTPKKGFTVPMAIWLKNDLKSLVLDTLSEEKIKKLGFLNYDYINNFIIKPHMNNKSNNHKKIWNIYVLIKWLENNHLI